MNNKKTISPEEHYKSVIIKYLSNRFPKVNKYMRFEFSKIVMGREPLLELGIYCNHKHITSVYFSHKDYDSFFTPLNEIMNDEKGLHGLYTVILSRLSDFNFVRIEFKLIKKNA